MVLLIRGLLACNAGGAVPRVRFLGVASQHTHNLTDLLVDRLMHPHLMGNARAGNAVSAYVALEHSVYCLK